MAKLRPAQSLGPAPNGMCVKGLITFPGSNRSGLKSLGFTQYCLFLWIAKGLILTEVPAGI